MLNTKALIDLMAHAIGQTPDARHRLIDTLNRAGNDLTSRAQWSWLVTTATLTVTQGIDKLELPDDWDQMISVSDKSNTFLSVQPVSVTQMNRLRAGYERPTYNVLYINAQSYSDQEGGDQIVRPQLMLWPAPATGTTYSLEAMYLKRWKQLDDTRDPTGYPNIPESMTDALVKLSRAMALGIEFGHNHPKTMTEQAAADAAIESQKQFDDRNQPVIGPLRGGASRFTPRGPAFWPPEIVT